MFEIKAQYTEISLTDLHELF